LFGANKKLRNPEWIAELLFVRSFRDPSAQQEPRQ
jgi:hypothetical protein